jgi:hypothetical protein
LIVVITRQEADASMSTHVVTSRRGKPHLVFVASRALDLDA